MEEFGFPISWRGKEFFFFKFLFLKGTRNILIVGKKRF